MSLSAVILAAGLGKRMQSPLPKVLHRVCGLPMLQHVVDTVGTLHPRKTIIIVGRHSGRIQTEITGSGVSYAQQEKPLGTADALMKASASLDTFQGTVLVLNGDTPLVTAATLRRFIRKCQRKNDALTVLSFPAQDPSSYGRIVRDTAGRPLQIVEEKDATPEQRTITEVNSGVYAMRADMLKLLARIRINRAKGEYYLTDLFEVAQKEGYPVGVSMLGSEQEFMGINTRAELLRAEAIMKSRIIDSLIDRGVRLVDPPSLFIHARVKIGRDSLIYPNVYLEGNTQIGRGCTIYPNVRIRESMLGDRVVIKDSSVIEESVVKRDAQVGPFAHLRPGSAIGASAKIGNFVEIKKSTVGDGSKASHLSYLGDATIGSGVNIGAGTITCNYDGREKHKTVIDDNVFIGSDTQLVAPVHVGKGAYVGAGSTVTDDVPPLSLALSRTRQRNILNWAQKRRAATGTTREKAAAGGRHLKASRKDRKAD